jgi:hypothetical protein
MQKNTNLAIYFSLLAILACLSGCSGSKSKSDVVHSDFFGEWLTASQNGFTPSEAAILRQKHGRMLNAWAVDIMGIAPQDLKSDTAYAFFFGGLHKISSGIIPLIEAHYRKNSDLNPKIDEAISRLKKEFPDAGKFLIWRYYSQFSNTKCFADTFQGYNVLGYSVEMFLNDTCNVYTLIDGFPSWHRRYSSTGQIPSFLLAAYLNSRYEGSHERKSFLDEAIYQGKLWYSLRQLFPKISPEKLFGYSKDEWKFFKKEEGNTWNFYISEKVLFNTDFNRSVKRYFVEGERTTGAGLPEECPPKLGCYTGLRIVEEYASKTGKSLKEIWQETNSNAILQQSGYNPLR